MRCKIPWPSSIWFRLLKNKDRAESTSSLPPNSRITGRSSKGQLLLLSIGLNANRFTIQQTSFLCRTQSYMALLWVGRWAKLQWRPPVDESAGIERSHHPTISHRLCEGKKKGGRQWIHRCFRLPALEFCLADSLIIYSWGQAILAKRGNRQGSSQKLSLSLSTKLYLNNIMLLNCGWRDEKFNVLWSAWTSQTIPNAALSGWHLVKRKLSFINS